LRRRTGRIGTMASARVRARQPHRLFDTNHYERLGVAPDATPEDIHAAYRRVARAHHPDLGNATVGADEMAAVNQAWFILRDPERRATYDREALVISDRGPDRSTAADPAHADLAEVTPRRVWWLFLITAVSAVTIGIVLLLIAFSQGY
jgi:curved DNA-binding protein CbpA